MKKLVLLTTVFIAGSANAGFLDGLSKTLGGVSNVLGAVTGQPTNTGTNNNRRGNYIVPLAKITPAQQKRIQDNIQANTKDSALNAAINEARDNIAYVAMVGSCQYKGDKLLAGQVFASDHSDMWMNSVIPKTKYHPLDKCMTVSSINNWHFSPRTYGSNVKDLVFHINYVSDYSQESSSSLVVMVNENGRWMLQEHR